MADPDQHRSLNHDDDRMDQHAHEAGAGPERRPLEAASSGSCDCAATRAAAATSTLHSQNPESIASTAK